MLVTLVGDDPQLLVMSMITLNGRPVAQLVVYAE